MERKLFRISCKIDAVLAAPSLDDALAYAHAQEHETLVESLDSAEALVSLSADEAVVVFAAVERALASQDWEGSNREMLQDICSRLADAMQLIDEQDSLRHRAE
jgi:hypothetical protein